MSIEPSEMSLRYEAFEQIIGKGVLAIRDEKSHGHGLWKNIVDACSAHILTKDHHAIVKAVMSTVPFNEQIKIITPAKRTFQRKGT